MRPLIVQGGMGVAVSDWKLARAVSALGQLGVVSGTGIDTVVARRLQSGDLDGSVRSALAAFPLPGVAERILDRYFIEGGKASNKRFRATPMGRIKPSRHGEELLVAANFAEVWLARQGHRNPVGINYLEKIQTPTLPSLYGAMLAGVDYVLMGAGIPRSLPMILDRLSQGEAVEMGVNVTGAASSGDHTLRFDPVAFTGGTPPDVRRPEFVAIVSSHVLATMLARRIERPVDGFVVEYPTAGGHNAPPRTKGAVNDRGEPVYGDKDQPDLAVIRDLGLPFWLAGSFASPTGLANALGEGAAGIQVGTAFAFCAESGLRPDLKSQVLEASRTGKVDVFTDPNASPTGFPFKIVTIEGKTTRPERTRVCDLGYLRTAYVGPDGILRWRCPAEPVDAYTEKGGNPADTEGRVCLCNALMANIGLGQVRPNATIEPPLLTSGDDIRTITRFLPPGQHQYTAQDVIDHLLGSQTPASSLPIPTP